jgi:hypothetical protein
MGFFNPHNKVDALTSSIFHSPKPDTKMKEVYSSLPSLCHAWASGNVPRGRTFNMFFENGIIYSWGHHYKAAQIVSSGSTDIVLINSNGYSTSTKNHLREIRRATSHLDHIEVPDVHPITKEDHEANITFLSDLVSDAIERVILGKKYTDSEKVQLFMKDVQLYCKAFNLKLVPFGDSLELFDLLDECVKVSCLKSKARDDAREVLQKQKEQELAIKYAPELERLKHNFAGNLKAWRSGEMDTNTFRSGMRICVKIPSSFGRTKTHYIELDQNEYSYIRIIRQTVETSDYADVPLSHALRLLDLIEKREAKKGARVGHYTLESVSNQDKEPVVVTIGCHKILLSEAREVLHEYQNESEFSKGLRIV